jgi:hypothetical protein
MALSTIPRYSEGVALAELDGTWRVVTGPLHPWGIDAVGYPTYRAAYAGWKLAVEAAVNTDEAILPARNAAASDDWWVDGHYVFATSARDALTEAGALYGYEAEEVRPWTAADQANLDAASQDWADDLEACAGASASVTLHDANGQALTDFVLPNATA